MSKIRSKGNKTTEIKLMELFKETGIKGWRRHPDLPGRPDFYIKSMKLAIFVDGCFWHLCPWCGHIPKENKKYWRKKLVGNRLRDKKTNQIIKSMGFKVLRIWEHRLKRNKIKYLKASLRKKLLLK